MNERSRELIGYIDVNPRIRELAERSGCKIDKLGFGEGNLEKFAELIVRECAKIVTIWSDEEPCSEGYDITPVAKIKKHFGVE